MELIVLSLFRPLEPWYEPAEMFLPLAFLPQNSWDLDYDHRQLMQWKWDGGWYYLTRFPDMAQVQMVTKAGDPWDRSHYSPHSIWIGRVRMLILVPSSETICPRCQSPVKIFKSGCYCNHPKEVDLLAAQASAYKVWRTYCSTAEKSEIMMWESLGVISLGST